ncbi:hypothetical protein F4678DRAFT_326897 [Xylaria arbuscula]|nr:hypothetical protein F4678DRAFT_326897 [Xylaria arbuscula]
MCMSCAVSWLFASFPPWPVLPLHVPYLCWPYLSCRPWGSKVTLFPPYCLLSPYRPVGPARANGLSRFIVVVDPGSWRQPSPLFKPPWHSGN